MSSYFDRFTAQYWDHHNDLAKHEPPRAVQILFERRPDRPGEVGYRITAPTHREVQDEINRLMSTVEDGSGHAQFRGPWLARRLPPLYEAHGKIIMVDA